MTQPPALMSASEIEFYAGWLERLSALRWSPRLREHLTKAVRELRADPWGNV